MKQLIPLLGLAGLCAAFSVRAATLVYEPFYVTLPAIVNYPVASPLTDGGKTNFGTGTAWEAMGTGNSPAWIGGSRLSYRNLATSQGWLILGSQDLGGSPDTKSDAALAFAGPGQADVYYSFLFTLNNITGMATNFATFTRLSWNTNDAGLAVGVRMNPGNPDQIDLAVSKNGDTNNWVFALTTLRTNTHLVIVQYAALPGAGDDVVNLWLNPPSTNIASGIAPPPTFTTTNGTDTAATNWNAFELYPPDNLTQAYFDEVRVATTWAEAAPEAFLYEGFNYPAGEGLLFFDGTGTNWVGGQTNGSGFPGWPHFTWRNPIELEINRPAGNRFATVSTNPLSASTIFSNSLTYPPLQISANRLQFPAYVGNTFDKYLQFAGSGSDIYYSYLLRLDGVATNMSASAWTLLSTARMFILGDPNDGFAGPGVFLRRNAGDTNKFDLGIHKRSNGGAVVTDASLQGLNVGTVYLIVAKYEVVAGTANDPMKIWINPPTNTLGQATEPTPTFSSVAGTDTSVNWTQFELYPPFHAMGFLDEIRAAPSWAKVTPTNAPVVIIPPTIVSITPGGGSVSLLCQGTAGQSYDVQRADNVTFTAGLTTLLTTNAPGGGQFTVTDAATSSAAFYRLKTNP